MTTGFLVIAIAVALIGVAVVIGARRRGRARARSQALRARFGPEYDRAVAATDRRTAESTLEAREARVAGVVLTELTPAQSAEFQAGWDTIQARVVDSPTRSVVAAQRLFEDVLTARGFPGPVSDRIDVLSVRSAVLASDYRAALPVAVDALDGHATTEACRQALLRYRRLFDGMLGEGRVVLAAPRARIDLRSPQSPPGRNARPGTPPPAETRETVVDR